MISYCIVDDDSISRRMIENIIEDCALGKVIGSTTGGTAGINLILATNPHVVLIDLLMPELDGIEMINELKKHGFTGSFIMISQIDNKEMVGEAYKVGIEFFIHKPINSIEVEAVLNKLKRQLTLDRSLTEIKQSLVSLERNQPTLFQPPQERTVSDAVRHILLEIGVLGESGSKDLIVSMELLMAQGKVAHFPALKELYTMIAKHNKAEKQEIAREIKAIEQRLRRTVLTALTNLASIGLTDYSNPKFEYYAPLFFDFQEVRLKMKELEEGIEQSRVKLNLKKFLHVLYLETLEKMKIK